MTGCADTLSDGRVPTRTVVHLECGADRATCYVLRSALLRATGDLLQGAHVLLLHQPCTVLWCAHRECTGTRRLLVI